MCLMVLAVEVVDRFPLFVAALREESLDRPSASPQFMPGTPASLAPRDLCAGGTWIGVNEHGLLAALTNRSEAPQPETPVSRGTLCRALLRERTLSAAVAAGESLLLSKQYAGCNLVVASREGVHVLEWTGRLERFTHTRGVLLVSNESLGGQPSERVQFVAGSLQGLGTSSADWLRGAPALLRAHRTATTPDVCLHRGRYGTVSMSVIALGDDPGRAVFTYAPGPPCRTVSLDYSRELQMLLAIR